MRSLLVSILSTPTLLLAAPHPEARVLTGSDAGTRAGALSIMIYAKAFAITWAKGEFSPTFVDEDAFLASVLTLHPGALHVRVTRTA